MREAISGLDIRSTGFQPATPASSRNEEEQVVAREEQSSQVAVSEVVSLSPEAVELSRAVQPTGEAASAREESGGNGRVPSDELPRFLDIRV